MLYHQQDLFNLWNSQAHVIWQTLPIGSCTYRSWM